MSPANQVAPGSASQKLFIVTRDDLTPGDQLAQVAHAMAEFAFFWPEKFEIWKGSSDYLVIKAVATEKELHQLVSRLVEADEFSLSVREPDLDTALTAVVAGPSRSVYRLLYGIPLALR